MWSIHETVNTVNISKRCAKDLFAAQSCEGELWSDVANVAYDGKLYFNPENYEHMDYLHDKRFNKVLRKHKVSGDICFGSLEGDNAGSFWGYRFDGKGGMKELVGDVEYEEAVKERRSG